jgi:hypothetical protein
MFQSFSTAAGISRVTSAMASGKPSLRLPCEAGRAQIARPEHGSGRM